MRKLFTKMLALTALILLGAGNGFGQTTYHAITDGEDFNFIKEEIEASDWVTYSTTNYAARDRCITPSSSIPNMSGPTRYLTLYVSGCEFFTLSVDGNSNPRYLDITINDNDPIRTAAWPNNCTTQDFYTNNTGDCIIKIAGVDGSLYPSIITFYAPACTQAEFSYPEGSDIEVSQGTALTAPVVTNTNTLTGITYSSSNETVVTVDETTGALTEVGPGEATITASASAQTVGSVDYCAAEATYTVTILSTSPVLETTDASLDLVLGKFAETATATFTISGYNLSGAASFTESLPVGFVLTPNVFTVTDGVVDQEFQLAYTATEAMAETSFDLVFAVGENSVTIPVAYGKEALAEWAEVSGITTWDFSGLVSSTITLTDETTPSKSDVFVFANLPDFTVGADFNAAALKVQGERLDAAGYWQGASLTFKVDKAGTIAVTFSNTGNRGEDETLRRYLNVQGNPYKNDDTNNGAINTTAITVSNIPVTAGEVTLYGTFSSDDWANAQYLRYYNIVYTPSVEFTVPEGTQTVTGGSYTATVTGEISADGTYPAGTIVTYTASVAASGYEFDGWVASGSGSLGRSINADVISTDNPYAHAMGVAPYADVTAIEATFRITTGIENPSIGNISFNGQTIFNPENIALEVYDTTGRVVIRSSENVDMSAMKGVYVVKSAQGTMKIAVAK